MSNSPNLLFVCSRNQWQSPTAEKVFTSKGFSVRSAGTSPNARHTLAHTDLQWANLVFVMENKHRSRIKARFGRLVEHQPIHVLDVPDNYQFMDQELVELLELCVEPYL